MRLACKASKRQKRAIAPSQETGSTTASNKPNGCCGSCTSACTQPKGTANSDNSPRKEAMPNHCRHQRKTSLSGLLPTQHDYQWTAGDAYIYITNNPKVRKPAGAHFMQCSTFRLTNRLMSVLLGDCTASRFHPTFTSFRYRSHIRALLPPGAAFAGVAKVIVLERGDSYGSRQRTSGSC